MRSAGGLRFAGDNAKSDREGVSLKGIRAGRKVANKNRPREELAASLNA
jgi:hypothetical protein